jgi:hypothetical protein
LKTDRSKGLFNSEKTCNETKNADSRKSRWHAGGPDIVEQLTTPVDVAARASTSHYSCARDPAVASLEAQYAEVSIDAIGLRHLNRDALNRGYGDLRNFDPKVSH